jgi:transposase
MLDAHKSFLNRRWTEGCHNAAQLWRELVSLGFSGRPEIVRGWATQRRREKPDPNAATSAGPVVMPHPPSGRKIARLLMADVAQISGVEQGFIAHLLQKAPGLADAVAIAKRLNRLLRRDSQESLDQVLDAASKTSLAEFAAGLRRDLAAVQAALDLPWTTSPAEGQINRLKMLKRTMYGRAGFKLLRARVLHAA